MLLEIAIADAYSAGFEYTDSHTVLNYNDLSRYLKHPRQSVRPGYYTVDTQMCMALAEVIISGENWTPLVLANKFVEVFKRDPRSGYTSGLYNFLKGIETGEQFLKEIVGVSDKGGAAVRAGPIGVFPTISKVIELATMQAKITHNSKGGIKAACAAALMSHYFIYHLGPKERLGEFLEEHVEGEWAEPWYDKVGPKGWMSVRAAITALSESDRMSSLLRSCVIFSGDVETVAAIALAAGSCSDEILQDLPVNLIWTLEDTRYGRDYLIDLDRQLLRSLAAYQG